MKRTSVKVLISASIILSMIPFLHFDKVHADSGPQIATVWSFDSDGTHTTVRGDFYYTSAYLVTNHVITIIVNDSFRCDTYSMALASGMVETDGEVDVDVAIVNTGSGSSSRRKWTYTLTVKNATYWHFNVTQLGTDSYWRDKLHAPQYWLGIVITPSSSYTVSSAKSNLNAKVSAILTAIQNGSAGGSIVDLSNIESLLNVVTDNQDTIIQQLEDIKALLETQSDSPAEDSINENTQTNENLQTEQENYEQLEQQFNSDFDNNLDDINVSDWTTRLTGWSSGVNWLKTQMNNMFTAMGDYKYILEIGMILAIALIFIGR